MSIQAESARQLREAFIGKSWSGLYLQGVLANITWEQSNIKIGTFNTIGSLVYHIFYYPSGVLLYVKGGELEIRDKYSFDNPPITSDQIWRSMINKGFEDVEKLAQHIESMPEDKFYETFYDKPYGSYFRNIHGIAEHCQYHLGQIVLLKKWIDQQLT